MHSVSLARTSCIGVFSEALRSFMRIRFDCQYLRALRSVYSNSSQTDATSPPGYVCVHSACLVRANCIRVLCESPPSCMRIRLDCVFSASPTTFGASLCLKTILRTHCCQKCEGFAELGNLTATVRPLPYSR